MLGALVAVGARLAPAQPSTMTELLSREAHVRTGPQPPCGEQPVAVSTISGRSPSFPALRICAADFRQRGLSAEELKIRSGAAIVRILSVKAIQKLLKGA